MEGSDAFVWFVASTLIFFVMLALGTFLAVHTYDHRRGDLRIHMPHLLPHGQPRRHRR